MVISKDVTLSQYEFVDILSNNLTIELPNGGELTSTFFTDTWPSSQNGVSTIAAGGSKPQKLLFVVSHGLSKPLSPQRLGCPVRLDMNAPRSAKFGGYLDAREGPLLSSGRENKARRS